MNSMYPKKTNGKKSPRSQSETAAPSPRGRTQVRRSGVHGKGVFALKPIPAGTRIIEYTGDIITWKAAQKRHPNPLPEVETTPLEPDEQGDPRD